MYVKLPTYPMYLFFFILCLDLVILMGAKSITRAIGREEVGPENAVLRIWIRDPGWKKVSIRIRDPG